MQKNTMPERFSLDKLSEVQLTNDKENHFLHICQQFSPDNQWLVYDVRGEGTPIPEACCIKMVHTRTGEIRELYTTPSQSAYGPGAAAVTFNPKKNRVLFIHGIFNCDEEKPYYFTRRTGVAVDIENPGIPLFLDARDVVPPFTPGALRGGTHAHAWSADGEWATFTYNDDIMNELSKVENSGALDLRMVGVMAPKGSVVVETDPAEENNNGELFSVVVTDVVEDPQPGSDEIDRAHEDAWVGVNGYLTSTGQRQHRAVAFLGDVLLENGEKISEVFVSDIPEDITISDPDRPLQGTTTTRPNPPKGTVQRRLTFTHSNKYPGIQGPRHYMRSLPDGSLIFFMMKDEQGRVQIFGVSPNGGAIRPITRNLFSIDEGYVLSPDGLWILYGAQNDVYVTSTVDGTTKKISPDCPANAKGLQSLGWSNDGKMICYNRSVSEGDTSYLQVFILK